MASEILPSWDKNAHCLQYNGVFQAWALELSAWCRKLPSDHQILNHPSNPKRRLPREWWLAQAVHYGKFRTGEGIGLPQTRGRLIHALKSGGLHVPRRIVELAQQEAQNSSATTQAQFKTDNSVFAYTGATGLQLVEDRAKRTPSKSMSDQPLTTKPEIRLPDPRKRAADDDLENDRPSKSKARESLFPSRPWPVQNIVADPFFAQSRLSAPPHHTADSNQLIVKVPDLYTMQHPLHHHSGMPAKPTVDFDLNKQTSIPHPETQTSKQAEGVTRIPSVADQAIPESENDTNAIYSDVDLPSEMEKDDDRCTTIVQEVEATALTLPTSGPAAVTFYETKRDGRSVGCRCFAFSENHGFLIYGYPKLGSTKWRDPLSRASRWDVKDANMVFYYSQLLHRGLPGTRSKEVAKWRLNSITHVSKQTTAGLDAIKAKLIICLSHSVEHMRSDTISTDARTPFEETDGQIQPWMIEEPAMSPLTPLESYDAIMNKWLCARSKLMLPSSTAAVSQSKELIDPDALVRPRCRVCDRKYRLCICDFCDACGELEEDCSCEKCDDCRLRTEYCTCEACNLCKTKYNVAQKVYCHCFCDDCGVKYSFECLSSLSGDDQYVGLGSTICECPLSWPQARELGSRLQLEREARQKALARAGIDKAAALRTTRWIQDNIPEYFDESTATERDRKLCLAGLCGTYWLVSDAEFAPTEACELVISSDDECLWGRFRVGDELHGLLRTNRVPKTASTEPVQCQIAVQQSSEGWHFDVLNRTEQGPIRGISFLGNGLISHS